jgi:pyruvate,water dikinase
MGPIHYISWLGMVSQADDLSIAPSHQQLSRLAQFGLPVLPGFILTADALSATLGQSKLQSIDWQRTKTITAASKAMAAKIKNAGLPGDLLVGLDEAYDQLLRRLDLKQADILIQPALTGHASYGLTVPERLVIRRKGQLKAAICEIYAGLYAAKNLTPELLDDLKQQKIGLSVLFQPLVSVATSGRLTVDTTLTVRAVQGRPEPLLLGQLEGDRYTVDPQSLSIVGRDLNRQEWYLASLAEKNKHHRVQLADQAAQKLSDGQILELAKWGLALTDHGDLLQGLEWQIDQMGRIWITTVLPVPVASHNDYNVPTDPATQQLLGAGQPLAIGTAVGPVRIVKRRQDLEQLEDGDILLSETADLIMPTAADVFGKISGWLIESGQVKSATQEQIEEFGLPLIRLSGLTHLLSSGTLVTIDGQTGNIYRGKVKPRAHLAKLPAQPMTTATKLYLKPTSLANLEEETALPSDGIGWLSSQTLLESTGEHPRSRLDKSSRTHLNQSVDQLCQIAAACRPRPVIYTINDLTSDQYQRLEGGERHEKNESNPLLGYRGAHRSLREPDLFKLELEAIRRVREDYGFDNLHLMLPFVRTMAEFTTLYHAILGSGLHPGRDFQLWLLCQVPANLLMLPELIERGQIQAVCLDLDSLTQLLLGVDHANPRLVDEFDARDQTVLTALHQAIDTARSGGLPVTAVGRSLEYYPDVIESLIASGVTGLVVDPANLRSIRQLSASAEQRLILDRVLDL